MGRVVSIRQGKKRQAPALPAEGSKEEQAMVSALYNKIMAASRGTHDIIICKAVAVFMGTLMTHTKTPGAVIGGFMGHIQTVANMAIAQHKPVEKKNGNKVYGTVEPEAQDGQPGPSDADASQSSDRGVEEPEGQVVLLPPPLQ